MQYITPHEKLQVAVIVGQDLDKSWTGFYHFCFIMLRVKRNHRSHSFGGEETTMVSFFSTDEESI